jgi:hypothetical protein
MLMMYAVQYVYIAKYVATRKPRSCIHKWKDTDFNKIGTLFGVLIL